MTTTNLVKLCVGVDSFAELDELVRRRSAANKKASRRDIAEHVTRMRPKQRDALLNGGSLYWVIKGLISARQVITDLEARKGLDGIERTAIIMVPELIAVTPTPRRAFQGWRYLSSEDAPRDLALNGADKAIPPELSAELADLGLL